MSKLVDQLNRRVAPRRLWVVLLTAALACAGNIYRDRRIAQLEKRVAELEQSNELEAMINA